MVLKLLFSLYEIVSVPDPKVDLLAKICHSEKTVYDEMQFIDVAGLIKGAHKGEGLGNQFLGTIRQVSVILHVVRCFENSDILHVNNQIDPVNGILFIKIHDFKI